MQKRLGLDLGIPDEFGWMMTGYTVGEGCFSATIVSRENGLRALHPFFQIGIRADDAAGIEYIYETLGVGTIFYDGARKTSNPTVRYRVANINELYHVIVPFFEKYPLPPQWKKARDFETWKRIIRLLYHAHHKRRRLGGRIGSLCHPQSFWDEVEPLVEQLHRKRQFPSLS